MVFGGNSAIRISVMKDRESILKQVCEMLFENEKNSPQIYADYVTLINADRQLAISFQFCY